MNRKEIEKNDKYLDITREIKTVTVIQIVDGAFGTVPRA